MSGWDELTATYRQEHALRGYAASAVKLRSQLAQLAGYLDPLEPGALESAHLVAYQAHLGGRGLSPRTVASYLQAARTFVRWLVRRGHLLMDPTADWGVPQPPPHLFRVLTVAEVERLLTAPDPSTAKGLRDRAVLECLYGLGLRLAECLGLNVADVDFGEGTVHVARVKGGRSRFLPLAPHLAVVVQHYLEQARPALARPTHQDALFVTERGGGRISKGRIQNLVRHYQHQAELPRVTPHGLRHACASHMLEAGAGLREVQALLGHAWVTSTQRYTHLVPGALQREHARTHPRARRRR